LLVGNAGILKPFRFAPIPEIGGRGCLDTANSATAWGAILEVTEIGPVFTSKRIPEREVFRVEIPVGNDQAVAESREVESVGRLEGKQSTFTFDR